MRRNLPPTAPLASDAVWLSLVEDPTEANFDKTHVYGRTIRLTNSSSTITSLAARSSFLPVMKSCHSRGKGGGTLVFYVDGFLADCSLAFWKVMWKVRRSTDDCLYTSRVKHTHTHCCYKGSTTRYIRFRKLLFSCLDLNLQPRAKCMKARRREDGFFLSLCSDESPRQPTAGLIFNRLCHVSPKSMCFFVFFPTRND